MAHRPKRRAGFGGANQPRMTAEEYEQLIGRHEHIEHKALNSEIAKEFAAITQNKPSRTVVNNDILYPPQPPPLPTEANTSKGIQFNRSSPWPAYSTIQRAAHMFVNSNFGDDMIKKHGLIKKFLQHENIPQVQIDIAYEVCLLIVQSENYWRKVLHLRNNYKQRYDDAIRKNALTNAIWSLQIAMTLHEFHLDHIVDIVDKKEIWSKDYDIECEQKERVKQMEMKQPHGDESKYNGNDVGDFRYDDIDDATTSYEEYEEYEDSEEQQISLGNKVADHMSVNELKHIQEKVKQQQEVPLDELFSWNSIMNGVTGDGKPVVFADNFETDLVGNNDNKQEEKVQFERKNDGGDKNDELESLYVKYPGMDKGLIQQAYNQANQSFDLTVFELDNMQSDSNAFFTQQEAHGK